MVTYGTSAREESVTEFGGFLTHQRLIVGTARCAPRDVVLKASKKEYHSTEVKQAMKAAMMHLEVLCEMSEVQMLRAYYFIHEHHIATTPWKVTCLM